MQYWENGISVEIIRKKCTSNDEEISEDSEISDDDHFDNDIDADVSGMVIETQGEMDKSTLEWGS